MTGEPIVVTIWERFYKATDLAPERWEFNHVELAEVPLDQERPLPKDPSFRDQAREGANGTWRHTERLRYPDGTIV